ncbi:MAG: hypothetical protein NE334_14530 [Lentisphaeraceae bacterium]|nr:hypothetical protein [Lentisphaeraceae bacterium]
MKQKSLDSIRKTLEIKKEKLRALQEEISHKEKTEKKLLREQRDNFRYVLGGLLQSGKIQIKYPVIYKDLYIEASPKDKLKFIKLGLIDENEHKVLIENKQDCRKSVNEIDVTELSELSEDDLKCLKKIRESFKTIGASSSRKKQIYGRQGELNVYLGDNYPITISDILGAYLRDHEGFFS